MSSQAVSQEMHSFKIKLEDFVKQNSKSIIRISLSRFLFYGSAILILFFIIYSGIHYSYAIEWYYTLLSLVFFLISFIIEHIFMSARYSFSDPFKEAFKHGILCDDDTYFYHMAKCICEQADIGRMSMKADFIYGFKFNIWSSISTLCILFYCSKLKGISPSCSSLLMISLLILLTILYSNMKFFKKVGNSLFGGDYILIRMRGY